MTNFKLGPRGEKLIKSYETLQLVAYLPTPNDVWTIGWGHTKNVYKGMKITLQQAEQMFSIEDVAPSVAEVNRLMQNNNIILTQSMFDALVSLVFNVGPSCISPTSTIGKSLRAGNYYLAWAGFTLWRKQAKKDLLGLARRRSEEMRLFLEDNF